MNDCFAYESSGVFNSVNMQPQDLNFFILESFVISVIVLHC